MADPYYTARLQHLARLYLDYPARRSAVLQRAALRAYPAPDAAARRAWLTWPVRWNAAALANDIDPVLWAWRHQTKQGERNGVGPTW